MAFSKIHRQNLKNTLIFKRNKYNLESADKIKKNILDFYSTFRKITVGEFVKVRKTGRIEIPHLSEDTEWESNKITINITNKSQEVSPFPSGDHKAAMNTYRRESMTNTRHE